MVCEPFPSTRFQLPNFYTDCQPFVSGSGSNILHYCKSSVPALYTPVDSDVFLILYRRGAASFIHGIQIVNSSEQNFALVNLNTDMLFCYS